MAPSVSTARSTARADPEKSPVSAPPEQLAEDKDTRKLRERLRRLRAHVEANSDYVGPRFADEARRIHAGDAPERAIHGEARPEEARALLSEGVAVMPLPFVPKRRTN